MLEFPEEFFLGEEREGFYVDSTMKSVWAAELEVLQEIAIICNRHNLQWFAWCGTLLGTVRHKGFVPWDDDIDIMMKREDFMELLRYLPEELPEGYDVRSALLEVEDKKNEYQCTVFNSTTVSITQDRLTRFHGCPFIVGVDIFPFDYLNRDYKTAKYQRDRFRLIRQTIWAMKYGEENNVEVEDLDEAVEAINAHCGTSLSKDMYDDEIFFINHLWKLANEVAMESDRRSGEYLIQYMNYSTNENKKYKKEWFSDVVYLPFEHIMMPVPVGYEEVLRMKYGDYNVIQKMTSSHNYPIYKSQLEEIRELYNRFEEAAAKDAEAERKWKEEHKDLF